MTQHHTSYPSFNFDEPVGAPYYASDISQSFSNTAFPPWDAHDSQTLEQSAPSPSLTVRTARSAPNPLNSRPLSGAMGSGQPQLFPAESLEPGLANLQFLTVPNLRRPRSATEVENPLARFYRENADSPWTPERMRSHNVPTESSSMAQLSGTYRNGCFHSLNPMGPGSDSGYQSLPSHSVISHDPEMPDHTLPPEVTLQIGNMHVGSVSSHGGEAHGPTPSVYSNGSTTRSNGKALRCPQCGDISKCNSDFKKHMSRHEKKYKCDIRPCRRGGKGFTTQNDLDRHKKSVHGIGALTNSYKCASEACRTKGKLWPRLDNFKQHIHRMHKDEDELDIIQRSIFVPNSSPSNGPMSLSPMDTALAGIGTERQFSNSSNELDDSMPGISLTPDQACSRWSFDPSVHGFSMDVDQSENLDSSFVSQDPALALAYRQQTTDQTRSFRRLDALADVATSHALEQDDDEEPSTNYNGQHTKTDAQRAALQRFSKLIQEASNNSPSEDLEDVILRVLMKTNTNAAAFDTPAFQHFQQDQTPSYLAVQPSNLTKHEVRNATKVMTEITRRSSTATSHPRSTRTVSPTTSTGRKCPHCPVIVARACDMRKHMKRHTKPYGCTFPKCRKRFGAKSDWKRHENSQHFQSEAFSCRLPCGRLFHGQEAFVGHLQNEHGLEEEGVGKEVKERRIGKNGQGAFWCGFCREVVRLGKCRNEAWDERFDHIDRHYNKEGRRVEEWLCVEAMRTKGELCEEIRSVTGEEEDGEQSRSPERSPGEDEHSPNISTTNEGLATRRRAVSTGKRGAEEDGGVMQPEKRAKSEVFIFCCACQGGPWATHTFLSCVDCNHQLCGNCETTALVGLE
ncbi:hypothetical protein M011DRAFT_464352 [Sporormia fimetaria CBS 119925]|uniref:C2H2-type domain-containing protein n=1 Tax=Sporormia fimetaria CBS 119925 TaxID=1340428 RepID=A0A6A6VL81_9PLEO|nr:hypothetical protein M011DRAFT_464352 [Sporormia fimetaria CBS 119925]